MNKAVNVEAPVFLQGVSFGGYAWGDIQLEGKLSDLGWSAAEFAEEEDKLTEKVLDGELDRLPDWGFASSKTVRGLTDGPVALNDEQKRAGRRYAPIEEQSHLFRTFNGLDLLDEEAISKFANKYGFLGLRQNGYLDGVFVTFEQYEDWFQEIAEMRCALTLYDTFMEDGEDQRSLIDSQSKLISEDKWGGFALNFKVASRNLDRRLTPNSYPASVWDKARNDYQLLFRLFFRELVNEKLGKYCSVSLNVKGEIEELEFDIQYAPWNLLGAMWLQVAMMAERKVIYNKCAYCGRAIEVSPGSARKDTKYCKRGKTEKSNPCKSAAFNERKLKTLELRARGLEVNEIARVVDSEPSHIVKWIKTAEAKQKPS